MLLCSGEVIKNSDIKCVTGEGMPTYKNPFEKGCLVVQFTVNFPQDDWLPAERIGELEKLLPPRVEAIIPDEAEICTLEKYDPSHQPGRRGQAYDEDDDDDHMGHGPRVQCANQ